MTETEQQTRILIVDDDIVDRRIVRKALIKAGLSFTADEAATGASALEFCLKEDYDCVILDYQLPDFSGADLLARVRRLKCDATPPAIFLTGQGNEDLALEVIEAGALDYVSKDEMSPPVLRRAIRHALSRQHYHQHLNRLALSDPLTGLANRSLFHSRVAQVIARTERTGSIAAVMLLDLDNFKDINDTLGHEAGDSLIKLVAERLSKMTRADETLARLGGDEFAIVTSDLPDSAAAVRLARRLLDGMAEPFELNGQACLVAASIGIGLCPEDGVQSDRLLGNADLALYMAKGQGGGTYCFYDRAMGARAHARRQLQTDLRAAVKDRQFEIYYQPKMEPAAGRLVGVEALIRWDRPQHGFVSPTEFVPVAEACGLMGTLGTWVLAQACEQRCAWQGSGLTIPVAVNLSPRQLVGDTIVGTVERMLRRLDMDPIDLELEFTETAVMSNLAGVAHQLNALSALGITITIDDFGTGYSSLARLQELPVHKLKIDRSLIRGLDSDCGKAVIVEAIVAMAKKLGLAIVAEGVETEAELEFVRDLGCDEVQGLHFCGPLPAKQIAERYDLPPQKRIGAGNGSAPLSWAAG